MLGLLFVLIVVEVFNKWYWFEFCFELLFDKVICWCCILFFMFGKLVVFDFGDWLCLVYWLREVDGCVLILMFVFDGKDVVFVLFLILLGEVLVKEWIWNMVRIILVIYINFNIKF